MGKDRMGREASGTGAHVNTGRGASGTGAHVNMIRCDPMPADLSVSYSCGSGQRQQRQQQKQNHSGLRSTKTKAVTT